MLKKVGTGFGVLAWLAGTVGFYLQLSTSGLSDALQTGIIVGWIAAGIVVVSFVIGREMGKQKNDQTLDKSATTGILRVYRRHEMERVAPLGLRIKNATSDIFFLGLSLPKLDTFTGLLEDKARDGVRVRLLVPDPCEKWLVLSIAKFLKMEDEYPKQLSLFFSNYLSIWKKVPTRFEVRVHKQLPSVTATMFDGRDGNIEIYMHGWRTGDRIMLELDFDGTAKDCKENLEGLWNSAVPLTSDDLFRERINAADKILQELIRRYNTK